MTFEEMQVIVEGMLQSQQQFQQNMEQEMNLFVARQREFQQNMEQEMNLFVANQQQFQQNMEQEMNLFLARQRELQESDLRRQSELDRVSQQIESLTGQVQGLTRIAELLVTNAQVNDRITEDHEQRIRRLEQE